MTDTNQQANDSAPGTLLLDASLSIADVTTFQETLKFYIDASQDVTVNGSQVETIDTVSMQLLVAFFRKVVDAGCSIEWHSPAEPILRTAQLLGLTEALSLNDGVA